MKAPKLKIKKCKYCRLDFMPNRPLQSICSPVCASTWAKAKREADEKKESNKAKKEWKEKNKTLSDWKEDLEDAINELVRVIDKGHGCISCGGHNSPQAGHLHSVGSNGSIRYNLHNLWVQDTYCNVHKSANTLRYIEGLRTLYGKTYSNYVQFDIVRLYPLLKLNINDIKELLPIVKMHTKVLKNEDKIYTVQQRKELRITFNNLFGLYPN